MKELKDFLKQKQEEGEKKGINIKISPTINSRVYILYNTEADTAVTVALKPSLSGETDIRAYTVNVRRWMWATDEGFTTDQIAKDLAKEIFERIELKKIIPCLQK